LFVLFKKLKKITHNNNSIKEIFDVKVEELISAIKNLSALMLKNDRFSENSSLQKSLSDIYGLLKKVNSAPLEINDGKINIDGNSNNHNFNSNSESIMNFKSSLSALSSPMHPSLYTHTPIQLDNNIIESKSLKDELENIENDDRNNPESLNIQNYENNSVDELRTLDKEILNALKRLEKTSPNTDLNKEK
ncbi:MAG TPA: hypothetical protein VGC75_01245, partial [Candidatus Nitrosocosmicus sp.]